MQAVNPGRAHQAQRQPNGHQYLTWLKIFYKLRFWPKSIRHELMCREWRAFPIAIFEGDEALLREAKICQVKNI
jgi:hypothetical protein